MGLGMGSPTWKMVCASTASPQARTEARENFMAMMGASGMVELGGIKVALPLPSDRGRLWSPYIHPRERPRYIQHEQRNPVPHPRRRRTPKSWARQDGTHIGNASLPVPECQCDE